MAKTLKQEVLSTIALVYNLAENSKLEESLFEMAEKELVFLGSYFHTSNSQALFLSIVFTLNYKGKKVDLDDLNSHFECNPMKLLEYSDDFVALYEKRLLLKCNKKNRHRSLKLNSANDEFYVNEIVSDKILNNEPIPDVLIESPKYEDIYNLLEGLYELGQQREEEEISTKDLFDQTRIVLAENIHLPLIDKMRYLGATLDEKFLFLYVIWKYLEGEKYIWVTIAFKGIYDKSYQRYNQIQRLLSGEHNLLKEDWIEFEDGEFIDNSKIRLAAKALDLLTECGILLFSKDMDKKRKENLILPDAISYRKLLFSEGETQQVEMLKNLLIEENLKITQERMAQKALPTGVTVLLHGATGTGKTETVLQLAKATGREIIKVDISSTRSKWFGDSEKIIKNVFKDYKGYAEKQMQTPILFFNEADAIISKRKEDYGSGVSDTENRVQNILLEEIENFEGILIATTNLANNLDTAFDRRFLFKIEFKKPDLNTKTQIWKSKMPHIPIEECEMLASQFDFSGGQIDNIVRKNEIHEIIYGGDVNLEKLVSFCEEELLTNQLSKTPIGFN
jgi:hypothetical protein